MTIFLYYQLCQTCFMRVIVSTTSKLITFAIDYLECNYMTHRACVNSYLYKHSNQKYFPLDLFFQNVNTFKFYLIVLLVWDNMVSPKKESLNKPLLRISPLVFKERIFMIF